MGCGKSYSKIRRPRLPQLFCCQWKEDSEVIFVQRFGELQKPFNFSCSKRQKGSALCIHGNCLYYCGGETKGLDCGVLSIDLVSGILRNYEKKDILQERAYHQFVELDDENICAIGGMTEKKGALRSAEQLCLDSRSNDKCRWMLADMNDARYDFGACGLEQRFLYVFGGTKDGTTYSRSIEVFDSVEDKWEYVHLMYGNDLIERQGCFATQIAAGIILVFGGFKEDQTMPTYYFETHDSRLVPVDLTTTVTGMYGTGGAPVAFYRGVVYVIDTAVDVCSYFTLSNKSWMQINVF